MVTRARWAIVAVGLLGGCGNPIEDGTFRGDVELRLRAVLAAPVLDATRNPLVGVVWLDYDALLERHGPSETSTLPISALGVGQFTFDVIEKPPSVGNYLSAQARLIPWEIRLGRLVLLSDEDANGAFAVGDDGRVSAPDRALMMANEDLLLYAGQAPSVSLDGTLLTSWRDARAGYQRLMVQPDPPPPAILGRVVGSDEPVVFGVPHDKVTE